MTKICSAASIANAFLSRAFRDKKSISPMKIQKLIYFAQGYSLALRNTPIVDELFEAWKFGPVIPSLYQECKKYRLGSISEYIHDYNNQSYEKNPASIPTEQDINTVIDFVWEHYGSVDAGTLSNWTHEQGGPWDQMINSNGGIIYRNQDIDNKIIQEYFYKKMQPEGEDHVGESNPTSCSISTTHSPASQ